MSTMTSLRRALAATTAAGVTAAGLTLVAGAAPAHADAANPTLAWEISGWFDNHLGTHTLDGGATEDGDGVITFVGGESSTVGGVQQVAYDGSVTGAFIAGVEQYAITLADPVVVLDGATSRLVATVSARVAGAEVAPATSVTLTTFDASNATLAPGIGIETLTATPRWADVLAPGSADATALGFAADKPLEGKAWDLQLLALMPASLRGHFHKSSTTASQETKAPATFVAELPYTPSVVPTVTSATPTGVTVQAVGTDFKNVTAAGGAGVYVGLAPSGGMPDVGSREGMDAFAAVAAFSVPGGIPWTTPMSGSGFTAALVAPAAKLDRTKSYSIYTWQAHTHASAHLDTETPVTINWSAVFPPVVDPTTTPECLAATSAVTKAQAAVTAAKTKAAKATTKVKKAKKAKKKATGAKKAKAAKKLKKAKKKAKVARAGLASAASAAATAAKGATTACR